MKNEMGKVYRTYGEEERCVRDLGGDRDRSEVLVNAVMNLWVSFSGRTLLYEVSYLPVQEILLQSVCICCQGVGLLLRYT